ncbi:integral membrane protein [Aspergillus sclerotialis]|uniref:Integral membrane protein n=1 Tax=Aspergillus sclerotialis TaxID=2070753 RepID=A0A3A2ZI76_9EURO|nr:integral membrane protein [Aspergillus sclerotialis]
MLEDDILAMDGWYYRTRQALDSVDRQMAKKRESKWLYLRLFYTEQFLRWNKEEWPVYLFFSLLIVSSLAYTLLKIRRFRPKIYSILLNDTILVLCFICTPLLIALFFAAGRVTMLPMKAGVHEMPKFGCCSQGYVFPQSRVLDLIHLYEEKRLGYVDMITEEYATQHDEIRWAITPSVIQHVGRQSSKEGDTPTSNKKPSGPDMGNFRFELNDPNILKQEHKEYLSSKGLGL